MDVERRVIQQIGRELGRHRLAQLFGTHAAFGDARRAQHRAPTAPTRRWRRPALSRRAARRRQCRSRHRAGLPAQGARGRSCACARRRAHRGWRRALTPRTARSAPGTPEDRRPQRCRFDREIRPRRRRADSSRGGRHRCSRSRPGARAAGRARSAGSRPGRLSHVGPAGDADPARRARCDHDRQQRLRDERHAPGRTDIEAKLAAREARAARSRSTARRSRAPRPRRRRARPPRELQRRAARRDRACRASCGCSRCGCACR